MGGIRTLRYPGICAICGKELPRRSRALWNSESHTVECLDCMDTPASTTSAAGRSALRKARRLEHNGSSSTSQWVKGGDGEEELGAQLSALREEGMIVRHDLRLPGTRTANIDHVVVARSGIHVIDAKRYTGRITNRSQRGTARLFVGSRDRTALVEKMAAQIIAVESATRELVLPTPVTAVICFVHGEWAWAQRSFRLNGVWIVSPEKLRRILRRRGPLSDAQMSAAGQLIFERLPLA